jgi:hypothetical protein
MTGSPVLRAVAGKPIRAWRSDTAQLIAPGAILALIAPGGVEVWSCRPNPTGSIPMKEDTPKPMSESITPSAMPSWLKIIVRETLGEELTLRELASKTDDVLTVLKLGYAIAIAFGLFLVWSFTTKARIPFVVDVSSVLFLLAVTALALLFFLLALLAALLPI